MVLLYILISTILISFIAFIGALTLFLKEKLLNKVLLIFVSFSAGALIGSAFLHLIPEAISKAGIRQCQLFKVFLYVIIGFCFFFILEQFISWHHHHAVRHPKIKSFSLLILISDAIHNFIDGVIIAGAFVVAPAIGAVTALAVALHEIPQEIGDFGVLLYSGIKKKKALFLNFLSAITVVLGGVLGFFLSAKIGKSIMFLLPFAAGNFIYIACSDLIPEIKNEENLKKSIPHFFVFLCGIIIMIILKLFTH